MVHIAEIMKPDYFAGCPNIALSEDELDSNLTKEEFSHIFPSFLTESVEDQMQKVGFKIIKTRIIKLSNAKTSQKHLRVPGNMDSRRWNSIQ